MKKRQKSKMTILIVGGLAAVSLVSVGFANWVLTGQLPDDQNITVTAGSVVDNSLTTTISPEGVGQSDLTLKFDNVSGGGSNKIFSNNGETEDLQFAIKFTIEGGVASSLNTVEFTFNEGIAGTSAPNPLTDLTGTNDAVDYLCYPWNSSRKVDFTYKANDETFSYNSGKNADPNAIAPTISVSKDDTDDSTLVATATFTFKWGKAFNYLNPGNVTGIEKDTLIARLRAFNTAFTSATSGGKTLSVTVTPTVKVA